MVRTNRSAYALRLGDRGGNSPTSHPICKNPQKLRGEQRVPIVDEVAFPGEEPVDAVADVACDLAHPETIRHSCNPGYLDPAR